MGKPYALRVAALVRERHPEAPVLFFANGGSSYLASQKDMVSDSHYHCLSLDWAVDIGEARKQLGADVPVQGNIDPSLLLGSVDEVCTCSTWVMGCCSPPQKGTSRRSSTRRGSGGRSRSCVRVRSCLS